MKNKNTNNQKGFTLIELLVAVSIFAVFIVVSSSSLVDILRLEQKTNILRKTQQDTRYILETIARDARESKGELDIGGTRTAHSYNINGDDLEVINTGSNEVVKTVYRFEDIGSTGDKNTITKTTYRKAIGASYSATPDTGPVNLNDYTQTKIVTFDFSIDSTADLYLPPILNITLNSESGRGKDFEKEEFRAHVDLETSVSPRSY